MEKLIDELIANAKNIYKLYLKVKECKTVQEQNKYKELIVCLVQKEENLLNKIREYYNSILPTFVVDLMVKLDINSSNVLDSYVEVNASLLPYLRVLLKLDRLLDTTPKRVKSEKIGNILVADENGEQIKDSELYWSQEDFILDTIHNRLELENMARFVNVSQNEILVRAFSETVANQKERELEVEKLLDQIPYDMAFLDKTLEDLFLQDCILNVSYKLFSVVEYFEDEFNALNILNAADKYNSELAIGEINKLLSPRKTRTNKVAYLRSLYLLTLMDSFDKSTFYEFFSSNKELIEKIKSPYSIIKRIQEEAETYLVEEIEVSEEEIKKHGIALKRQKTKENKKSNGGGVN